MKQQPLVSVIINCYNGEKYLCEAIDSVIAQTYTNWEIIFWDNQSTDGTAEIVKSYKDERIRYFYAPVHTPLGEARNLAMREAEGVYFAFLDADDVWNPQWIDSFTSVFLSNPKVTVVYTQFIEFNETNERLIPKVVEKSGVITLNEFIKIYRLGLSGAAFACTVAADNQIRFDSTYMLIEDYDFFLRLGAYGDVYYIADVNMRYRSFENNLSHKSAFWTDELKRFQNMIESRTLTYEHLYCHLDVIKKRIWGYDFHDTMTKKQYLKAFLKHPRAFIFYLYNHVKEHKKCR